MMLGHDIEFEGFTECSAINWINPICSLSYALSARRLQCFSSAIDLMMLKPDIEFEGFTEFSAVNSMNPLYSLSYGGQLHNNAQRGDHLRSKYDPAHLS